MTVEQKTKDELSGLESFSQNIEEGKILSSKQLQQAIGDKKTSSSLLTTTTGDLIIEIDQKSSTKLHPQSFDISLFDEYSQPLPKSQQQRIFFHESSLFLSLLFGNLYDFY